MELLLASQIGSDYWNLSVGSFAVIVVFLCIFAALSVALAVLTALELIKRKRQAEQVPAEEVVETAPTEQPAPAEEVAAVAEEVAPTILHVQHEPVVIVEESFEGGTLRYDKSFTARLIQSDDEVKNSYTELKNFLLSYKGVHDRMSWKRETYRLGRDAVAKLAFRGNTLCIYLPLDPESYADTKYKVENASDTVANEDTPLLYRLKNARRFKYAEQLFEQVMANRNVPKNDREAQDYYLPYEGLMELIKKGLIKRNIKSAGSEAIFHRDGAEEAEQSDDPVEIAPGVYVVPDKDE